MHKVAPIFSELLKLYPRYEFEKSSTKNSLRDIETGLMAQASRWYHHGLTNIRKSTLSDANSRRNYRIFQEMFYHLLSRCKDLTPKHKFRFKNPLYSIDATTIDLCLSVFLWAKFRKAKGAIKMRCIVCMTIQEPCSPYLTVTDGKKHDV